MKNTFDLQNLKFIDLTHVLSPSVPQWHSGCGFQSEIICDYSDCKEKAKFRVQKLQMSAGIGTHMDAPLHCFPYGKSIADITLENLVVTCVVVDVSTKSHETYIITDQDVKNFENKYGVITKNTIVIFNTGWGKFWHDPIKYRNDLKFPTLSKEVAELLLKRNVVGVGIDTLSPDSADSGFPVHQILLGAGKYIIENVANANLLPPSNSIVIGLPLRVEGGTESPVRLIAMIKN